MHLEDHVRSCHALELAYLKVSFFVHFVSNKPTPNKKTKINQVLYTLHSTNTINSFLNEPHIHPFFFKSYISAEGDEHKMCFGHRTISINHDSLQEGTRY